MAWPTEAGVLTRAQAAPREKVRTRKPRSAVYRATKKPPLAPATHTRGKVLHCKLKHRKPRKSASGVRQQYLKLNTYYVDVAENYRIFNAAVFQFYKSTTGPPLETDSPFRENATLAGFSPADVFGNGTHYLSVSYFNGVLDSGFLPLGPNGETYLRLDVGGGVEIDSPPDAPMDVRLVLQPGGVVSVQAVYAQQGPLRATEWALTYTLDGSTPGTPPAIAPTATTAIQGTSLSVFEYDLPAQANGTTVKVRTQVRRLDGATWVYSAGSSVLTAVADALGPAAPEGAGVWRGAAPQEL